MKKSLLAMTALAAMLFAGCTSSDEITTLESIKQAENAPTPISFGTYMGKTGSTRGGHVGLMNNDLLKTTGEGFGVFGYYTNASGYQSSGVNISPVNFMYNQHVTWDDPNWAYSPLKYWPNETASSNVDQHSASSTGGPDKLTFFAYTPYVTVNPSTGAFPSAQTSGITALTSNTVAGDPKVSYTLATDADDVVDLCWAVVPNSTSYTIAQSSTPQSMTDGFPNIDLTKQTVGEKIEFLFKHALAKLTFSVQGSFNEVTPSSNDVDGSTRIVVDNVAITTTFPKHGVLNLNNTTANVPLWDTSGSSDVVSLNINNDDIVAGSAGAAGLRYNGTDTYASQPLGVTKTKQYLMDADGTTKFFTLIPETKNLTITITYHVYTVDTQLSTGWSKVTNVITKTISNFPVAGGSWYNINMILGMTSVKFNASVAAWSVENSTDVDLPINEN